MFHALLDQLGHERHCEIRRVGVGPGPRFFVFPIGQVRTTRAGGQGALGSASNWSASTTRSSSIALGVTVVAKQGRWFVWFRNKGSTGWTTGVMWPMHSVWVQWPCGLNKTSLKLTAPPWSTRANKPFPHHRSHAWSPHTMRWDWAAVADKHCAQVDGSGQVGLQRQSVPLKMTNHAPRNEERRHKGAFLKVDVQSGLLEQVTDPKHACRVGSQKFAPARNASRAGSEAVSNVS